MSNYAENLHFDDIFEYTSADEEMDENVVMPPPPKKAKSSAATAPAVTTNLVIENANPSKKEKWISLPAQDYVRKSVISIRCNVPKCNHISGRSNCSFKAIQGESSLIERWIEYLGMPRITLNVIILCSCHFADKIIPDEPPDLNRHCDKISKRKCSLASSDDYVMPEDNDNMDRFIEPTISSRKTVVQKMLEENSTADKDPCSVLHCISSSSKFVVKHYSFPSIDRNSSASLKLLQMKRHDAWTKEIPLKPTHKHSFMVCSKHFVLGEPADILNYCHVDWVPTLKLAKNEVCNPLLVNTIDQYKSYRKNMGEWLFGTFKFPKPVLKTSIPRSTPNNTLTVKPISLRDIDNAKVVKKLMVAPQLMLEAGPKLPAIKGISNRKSIPTDETEEFDEAYKDLIVVERRPITKNFKNKVVKKNTSNCLVCGLNVPEPKMKSHIAKHLHKYECEQCGAYFTKTINLAKHTLTHKDRNTEYICQICGKLFILFKHFKEHTAEHLATENPPISCDLCSEIFEHNFVFCYHLECHEREKLFKCSVCDTKYTDIVQSISAKKRRFCTTTKSGEFSDSLPYKCEQCSLKFIAKDSYILHLRKHEHDLYNDDDFSQNQNYIPLMPDKNYSLGITNGETEPFCDETDNNSAGYTKTTITNGEEFTFFENGLQLENQYQSTSFELNQMPQLPEQPVWPALESTKKSEGSRKFSCKMCKHRCSTLILLRMHYMEVHKKLFRCKVCNVIVAEDLLNHGKLHRICTECHITFPSQNDLDIHIMETH